MARLSRYGRTAFASKASKGFSKHLSPNAQLALGFFVVFMSITPAIFFSVTLATPYYSVEQSNCDVPVLKNLTQWGANAQPMPMAVWYKDAGLLSTPTGDESNVVEDFPWMFEDHWTMWLHAGMCPNGKELASGKPEEKYCLPWKDEKVPTIWQKIDLYNQFLIAEGHSDIKYSDMEQGAKNFMQAWQMTVPACVFAWVLVIVSLVTALYTDEHIELKLDKDVHTLDHKNATPEELAEHILHIDEKVDEHTAGDASYTYAIAAEFVVYLTMFGMAASILKLVEEGDFIVYPQSWQGLFPTCTMAVKPMGATGILYYQCVSMGLYVAMLFFAELYYISEYINHCMHHYLTHPDEQEHLKAHADSTGEDANLPDTWKGPKFATRLHLLKVRAIKTVFYAVHNTVREETDDGRRFREAHEGSVRLNKHKDKLKRAHKKKAGHDDVEGTNRESIRRSANSVGGVELGHGPPPAPSHAEAGVAPPRGFL